MFVLFLRRYFNTALKANVWLFLWQHQTIKGSSSGSITTLDFTASTTSRDGQMRLSASTASFTVEKETCLLRGGGDSDSSCPKTRKCEWCLRGKTGERILVREAQEKLMEDIERTKFACWMMRVPQSAFKRSVITWVFLTKGTGL